MNKLLIKEFEWLLESLEMTKNHYTTSVEFLEGITTHKKHNYKHLSEEDFTNIKKQEQKFKHIYENILSAIEQTGYLRKRIEKLYS